MKETIDTNRAGQVDAPVSGDEVVDTVALLADCPSIVEAQRTLARYAVTHPTARFDNIFPLLLWPPLMHEGLLHLLQARGARTPGPDGLTARELAAKPELHRETLAYFLRSGLYAPDAVRVAHMPKAHGSGTRPIAILSLYDRWVQQILKLLLDPIFEGDFLPQSHGFRRGRSCLTALAHLRHLMEQPPAVKWVIEGDIEDCFERIDHSRLLPMLGERIADTRLLQLIGRIIVVAPEDDTTPTLGLLQGGVLSPLLANIYLHRFDVWLTEVAACRAVRYADDFVVLSPDRHDATAALVEKMRGWLAEALALTLSARKTTLTSPAAGFDSLGYQVIHQHGKKRMEVRYRSSHANCEIATHRLKVLTDPRRFPNLSAAKLIARLNQFIRTWSGYFRHSSARTDFALLGMYAEVYVGKWLAAKYNKLNPTQLYRRYFRKHTSRAEGVALLELEHMAVGPIRHRLVPHPYIFPTNRLPRSGVYQPPPPLFVSIGEYTTWRKHAAV